MRMSQLSHDSRLHDKIMKCMRVRKGLDFIVNAVLTYFIHTSALGKD